MSRKRRHRPANGSRPCAPPPRKSMSAIAELRNILVQVVRTSTAEVDRRELPRFAVAQACTLDGWAAARCRRRSQTCRKAAPSSPGRARLPAGAQGRLVGEGPWPGYPVHGRWKPAPAGLAHPLQRMPRAITTGIHAGAGGVWKSRCSRVAAGPSTLMLTAVKQKKTDIRYNIKNTLNGTYEKKREPVDVGRLCSAWYRRCRTCGKIGESRRSAIFGCC